MSVDIKPMREASWMLTRLPSVGLIIPPVQAWASSNLWAVIESTRPRCKASVIETFSTVSVSKTAPTGSTSPTTSRGDSVIDTLDNCFCESDMFLVTELDEELLSIVVIVFVVVVLVKVGDSGLDTTFDEEEDEKDDVIGAETSDVLEVDDVTEDELKEADDPEVDTCDDDLTDDLPDDSETKFNDDNDDDFSLV